ncbi:Capping Protein Inhibiting Regulator Of Actin Dynamics [Manis pentadactyla]|nr:Capping Protein Inhibiting Regulator Of Actin Dynamics [Manis pentadactyla]
MSGFGSGTFLVPIEMLQVWGCECFQADWRRTPNGAFATALKSVVLKAQPVRSAQVQFQLGLHLRKAAESPAGKRLPPPRSCGGASRASPASGVKKTATALRVGRYPNTETGTRRKATVEVSGSFTEKLESLAGGCGFFLCKPFLNGAHSSLPLFLSTNLPSIWSHHLIFSLSYLKGLAKTISKCIQALSFKVSITMETRHKKDFM